MFSMASCHPRKINSNYKSNVTLKICLKRLKEFQRNYVLPIFYMVLNFDEKKVDLQSFFISDLDDQGLMIQRNLKISTHSAWKMKNIGKKKMRLRKYNYVLGKLDWSMCFEQKFILNFACGLLCSKIFQKLMILVLKSIWGTLY